MAPPTPAAGSSRDEEPPLSLRSTCLRLLASALLVPPPSTADAGCSPLLAPEGAAWAWAALPLLPQELRQEFFLLLARWQLLGDAACGALGTACFLMTAPTLSLAGCCLLSEYALASHLFKGPLPRLESLSLRGVPSLTDALLRQALDCCPGLCQLDISQCLQLSDAAVAALGVWQASVGAGGGESRQGRPAAAELLAGAEASQGWAAAAGGVAATEAGGSGSAASSGSLQSLNLGGCWQIGDISALAACMSLTSLSLDGCWRLRGAAVREVLACLPQLEALSLSGCFLVGSALLVSRPAPASAPELPQAHLPPPLGEAEAGGVAVREGSSSSPGLPLAGVQLCRLRSLELRGTAVQNDLLFWVALRCCARLQKLGVAGCKRIDGLGIAAVLSAKRVLLQQATSAASATSLAAASSAQQQQQTQQGGASPLLPLEVLPLLELDAGSLPRWVPAVAGDGGGEEGEPHVWWQEQQAAYERRQGPVCLHPSPDHPPIPWHLTPTARQPAAAQHAEHDLASWQPAEGSWTVAWPPESAADVLLCLGPKGLGQLEGLDLSQGGGERAGAVGAAAAAVVGQHCGGLRRLSLSGCQVSDAEMTDIAKLPSLTKLDVSGCTGSKPAAPGSQFQRRPAKRRQLSGVSDDSLAILAQRSAPASYSQQQPQQGSQEPDKAAAAAAAKLRVGSQQAAGSGGGSPGSSEGAAHPLQSLNAGGLLITDASIGALAGLTALQLRGCKRVSDMGVLHCLLASPQLVRLDLGGCSQLAAGALGCSFANGSSSGQQEQHGQGTAGEQQSQQRAASERQLSSAVVSSLAHAIPRWVALPKQAAGAEVMTWLSGHAWPPGKARSSGGGSGEGNGGALGGDERAGALGPYGGFDRGLVVPLGCTPLQKLEINCSSWPSLASSSPTSGNGTSSSALTNRKPSQQAAGQQATPQLNAALLALAAACPQLRSLQLLSAGGLGPGFAPTLAAHCPLLRKLSITDCCQLSNADFAALARLPVLQHLNLSGCTQLGDTGLQHFAAVFGAPLGGDAGGGATEGGVMTPTDATGGDGAKVGGGIYRRRQCLLQTLRLDGCGAVGDAGVGEVLQVAPHLETLSLRRLQGVTDATAGAALAGCANLRALLLAGSGVRGDFLYVFKSCPAAFGGSARAERGKGAVMCLGLGVLELPQGLRARLQGTVGLQSLWAACAQLIVKFK